VKKTPERKALEKLVMDCETYLVALDLLMQNHKVSLLEGPEDSAPVQLPEPQGGFGQAWCAGHRLPAGQASHATCSPSRHQRATKFLSDQKKAVADMGVP
jgi:hypothetical protein